MNITREEFELHRKGRPFKIIFKRDEVIDRISKKYSDVKEGEKLALFNAAGYLEIAINKGNAAGLAGLFSSKQLRKGKEKEKDGNENSISIHSILPPPSDRPAVLSKSHSNFI